MTARAAELRAQRQAEQRARALAAADQRIQQAKHRFSLAYLACLRNALDAPAQVQKALAEIDAARAPRCGS